MGKESARRRHHELTQAGWVRRFTGEAGRISDLKTTYESLGMETTVENGVLGEEDGCRSCYEIEEAQDLYRTLYTRGQAKVVGRPDDDLFE
jgi:hypothetical protein